ncbi:uncharacterized protein LOC111899833 [Lactuca sativa]|uniref:uncharacterized protein LOC111899833 n=1 Tax=Lactuca sativa TaxID=4236 RepID=UPI000CA696B3|nr:uncharacterized protein LOC111899833 [Lactuca sativa]
MAGSSSALGFPKSQCCSSLREQLARTTLRNVRLKGHSYVELREDNKKPIFFCVLCLSPCHNDSVLHDHLRGHLHKKNYEAAKSTLLKENPWPFNDGMLFFHTPCNENNPSLTSNPNLGSNLLLSESNENNSLAIVASNGSPSSSGDEDKMDVDENGYHLIVPQVLHKDRVTDLEVRSIGLGKIGVRYYQKDGVRKGISRIWCEWIGNCHPNQDDTIPHHDFAILSFSFHYDMGRRNVLDEMLFLPSSEVNKENRGKKRKSFSDPEDVSESLSNQCESSGEEYLASGDSSSRKLVKYNDNSLKLGIIPSRSVRKELRVHRRVASERVCDICQHKILLGKDVATLLNMKTGRLVCSSRNLNGAFHVFHISCLVHWVLFCDYEVYTKQLVVAPKVKKRGRRKKGVNITEAEKEERKQIYCAFCPECQGTGIDIDGDELEKPTVSLSEMFRYKMKASDGHREYRKCPEMLQNCSTGFHFPTQSEETMQENVSPLKMLRFYRAV